MPELTEVEDYKRILILLKAEESEAQKEEPKEERKRGRRSRRTPNASKTLENNSTNTLIIETPSPTPPKNFPSKSELALLKKCHVVDVERKGKLLRVLLQQPNKDEIHYMYIAMGMTGRISSKEYIPTLESLTSDTEFPPPHTHLIMKSGENVVAFSDSRRFGGISFGDPYEKQWNEFATDAMDPSASLGNCIGQKKAIKGLLLDQRFAVSGIGNWIADEMLYQSEVHPDQTFLTKQEVTSLEESLVHILHTGNECLMNGKEFPAHWLFHRRWSKAKAKAPKDHNDKCVKFISSGGRTAAFVPTIQKLKKRKAPADKDSVSEKIEKKGSRSSKRKKSS